MKQTKPRKSPARKSSAKRGGAKAHAGKRHAPGGHGGGRGGSRRPPLSRARLRANARTRRKRSAGGLRAVALALGGLLAVALLGGGLLGVSLDRAGLLDRVTGWGGLTPAPRDSGQMTFAALEAMPQPVPPSVSFARFDPEDFAEPEPVEPYDLAAAPREAESPVRVEAPEPQAKRPLPPLGSVGAVSLAALVAETLRSTTEVSFDATAPDAAAGTRAEPYVVYEEPLAARDLMPPPSDHVLDSFVAGRRVAARNFGGSPGAGVPQWQRNAVQIADVGKRPMIALVLDDLGLNRPATRRTIALPAPLTLAFMTYAENIEGMLADARSGGHELLVHMPMEPRDHEYDPGPNVLSVDLSADEIVRRVAWGLKRFDGYVGINNHMGSHFTTSLPGMAQVMEALRERGLLFLDSKTAESSVGSGLAERMGVPYAERDIFIDNDFENHAAIERQLDALESLARRRGFAVGIGHPHDVTLDVLERWLPAVQRRGFALVPISAVARRRIELARASEHAG